MEIEGGFGKKGWRVEKCVCVCDVLCEQTFFEGGIFTREEMKEGEGEDRHSRHYRGRRKRKGKRKKNGWVGRESGRVGQVC